MSRVLLLTSAEKGHLNPMVGVAQWLRRDGHYVGWLTLPEPAPQLAALDVEAVPVSGLPAPPPLVTGGEALARLVLDADALRGWIRTLLLDAVPGQVEPVRQAMAAFRPDVVALDGMLYQGVIAAQLEGLPWAGISSALTLFEPAGFDSELLRTVRALADERDALFERYGMPARFRTCECLSPRLNVVFATRELVGDAELPEAGRLVGPSRPLGRRGDEVDFPWERLDGRPLVLASFGSQIAWQPRHLAAIAEAACDLGAQVVMSAGELADTGFGDGLPGDPIVRGYVPQLELLPRVDALVSHGGANSVLEATRCGVPQLLVPICNDQPLQAFFVGRAGTGLVLEPERCDGRPLREALAALLSVEGPERRRAREIAAAWAERDGAREAARALAALAA